MTRVWLGSIVALCALAGGAAAQTPAPGPTPGPGDPAEPGVTSPGDAEPTAPAWSLFLGVGSDFSTNVRFTAPPSGDDLFGRASAALRRVRQGRRTRLSVGVDAAGVGYVEDETLNQFNYGGAVRLDSQLSRRLRLGVGGRFASGYSTESTELVSGGLLLPRVRTVDTTADGKLAWRLSDRTDAELEVHYYRVAFDGEDLVDGETLNGQLNLLRRLGPERSFGLTYRPLLSDTAGLRETFHSLGALWRQTWHQRKELVLGAGVAMREAPEVGGRAFTPVGGVVLSSASEHRQLRLSVSRELNQAYGTGRDRIANVLNLRYESGLSRALRLSLSGDVTRSEDLIDDGLYFDTYGGTVALSYSLARELALSFSYDYRQRESPTVPSTSAHTVTLSMGYTHGWQ